MKCSICNKEGHRANNTKFHPKTDTPTPVNPDLSDVGISDADADADAERSATEWAGAGESLIRSWLVGAIKDRQQHRDIGKVLANSAEIYVIRILSELSGRILKKIDGKPYDAITDDGGPVVRIQIKFRMEAWHFETTRRNSKKNADTNATGHVAYKKDEFDMVAIFVPGPAFGITGSRIRCIPVEDLINPAKPDQLITQINVSLKKIYDNSEKTAQVIKTMLQILPSPLD
jgi:hypothetical protein